MSRRRACRHRAYPLGQIVALSLALALMLLACNESAPSSSQDISVVLQEAKADLKSKNADAAIQKLERALKADPRSSEGYQLLGNAYVQKQQFAQAEERFLKAISLDPENVDARANLGVTYYQQGKLEQAEQAFRTVLAKQPDDAEMHYNLGGALASLNKLDEAVLEFLRARELNPSLPEPYLGLGSVYKLQGKRAEAIDAFKEYLKLAPTDDSQAMWRVEAQKALQELGMQP